jgi:Zn-dependent metalloprotease
MKRMSLLSLLALFLALPGLRAADDSTSLAAVAASRQSAASSPAEENLTFHTDARFGRVLFIRNDAAQPTPAEVTRRVPQTPAPAGALFNRDDLGKPEWTNAVATARDFLRRHASEFLDDSRSRGRQSAPSPSPDDQRRLTSSATAATTNAFDPDTDLVPLRAERDALGMTHVRFTQTYRGLPVFGADATVHLAADGRVSSAGARLVPDIQVDLQPTLTREQAVTVAVAMWQAQFQRTETPEATSAALCILAPGLLKNDGNLAPYLVWEVKLALACKDAGKVSSAENYYLDAQSGAIREQLTEVHSMNRKVADCSAPVYSSGCPFRTVDGYNYGRVEEDPPVGASPRYLPDEQSLDTDNLYDKLADIHQFYQSHFGRDGASNQGGTGDGYYYPWRTYGLTYLDFSPGMACPNALHYRGTIQFCKDMVVDDVVAHEYAHAVVMHCFYSGGLAAGMTYQGQAGALNESHSDVMGEMFELAKTGACNWIFASDTRWGDLLERVLYDPPSRLAYYWNVFPPDRFHSPLFYCGGQDDGGVHINSTVPSKAAWLLSRGGYFNGCTISPLGEAKVAQIVYRAVTQYYAQTETFNGAYAKWIQAATDLYGADSDEVRQTTRALQAVELDQPGYCSGIPAHPPAATDVPPGPLTVTPAGPDLVLSWPPVPWLAGEPVLLATTNLTTGPWTALTAPLTTNVVTVPATGAAQYFRLRIP